jgi:phage shock protein C
MSMDDPLQRPLMRVRQGRLIAGVCGGIAKWLGWDPTLVRLGYVVLTVVSAAFPGVIVYILLWILMPQEPA